MAAAYLHNAVACNSVCLSHPHGWISQKRCKLASANIYCRFSRRLVSAKIRKAFPQTRTGSPQPKALIQK